MKRWGGERVKHSISGDRSAELERGTRTIGIYFLFSLLALNYSQRFLFSDHFAT